MPIRTLSVSSPVWLGVATLLAVAGAAWWTLSTDATPAAPARPALPAVTGPPGESGTTAAAPRAALTAPAAPAAASAASPVPTVSTPPGVTLLGVARGAGGRRLAVVSVDGGNETLVRVGDRVGAAGRVVGIDDRSMTYRLDGSDHRVALQPAGGADSATAASTTQPQPMPPGFIPAAPSMAQSPGTVPGSGNEAFRQAVQRKQQAIATGR